MAQSFHTLRLHEKVHETIDSVSLVFEVPEELRDLFAFEAGQYITIKHTPVKDEIRRSYSLCAAPSEGVLKVNSKKVEGGQMSSWLVEKAAVGDLLEISRPEGSFTAKFDAALRRHHYFIAAGSGITPIMSLIKEGLELEPMSKFVLLFGNKNEEHIIFNDELRSIENHYGSQLKIVHTLSQKKSTASLFARFKKSNKSDYWSGRIDTKKMKDLLRHVEAHHTENHFYLCGPGEMILAVESWLKASTAAGLKIHKEYFTSPDQKATETVATQASTLTYKNLHGQSGELKVPEGKSLLDALMDEGVDPPFSCMNGVCSSCVAKLTKGKVQMDSCLALEDDEIEAGYILTCQSHAITPEIELHYEG